MKEESDRVMAARHLCRERGDAALRDMAGLVGWSHAARLLELDIVRRLQPRPLACTPADVRNKVARLLRKHGQEKLAREWEVCRRPPSPPQRGSER